MQNKIDRRQFIKQTLALGATLGASSLLSPLTKQLMAAVNDCDLAVVKGPVAKAAAEAIRLMGGMKRFVKPGDKVLIKPNMSFPNPPSSASNTHPDLLRTVVKQCLDSGAKKVLVVDHVLSDPQLCLNKSGLAPACKDLKGVHVLAVMEEKFFVDFPIKNGKVLSRAKELENIDPRDAVNKLVSAGIKRMFIIVLDAVGSFSGVNTGSYSFLQEDDLAVYLGGGVRDINDITRLRKCGYSGCLIASCLYNGSITLDHIHDYSQ